MAPIIRRKVSKMVMNTVIDYNTYLCIDPKYRLIIFQPAVMLLQCNLSVTTTSIMKFITCDLFSNVFWWRLKVPIYSC